VRKGVQLRRMLPEHQHGSDQEVDQAAHAPLCWIIAAKSTALVKRER
jgi:hypothetical protein